MVNYPLFPPQNEDVVGFARTWWHLRQAGAGNGVLIDANDPNGMKVTRASASSVNVAAGHYSNAGIWKAYAGASPAIESIPAAAEGKHRYDSICVKLSDNTIVRVAGTEAIPDNTSDFLENFTPLPADLNSTDYIELAIICVDEDGIRSGDNGTYSVGGVCDTRPPFVFGLDDSTLKISADGKLAVQAAGIAAILTALDLDVVQADGKYIATDKIRARDGDGLKLYEDGGSGIFVKDGGNVGIGTTSPPHPLSLGSDADAILRIAVNNTSTGSDAQSSFALNSGGYEFIYFVKYSDGDKLSIWSTTADTTVYYASAAGDHWFAGDVSALSFTDRTPFPPKSLDCLAAIKRISRDAKGGIDHATLPDFARRQNMIDITETRDVLDENGTPKINPDTGQKLTELVKIGEKIEEGRDLGAMISIHDVALQQLLGLVETLQSKVTALEKKAVGGKP